MSLLRREKKATEVLFHHRYPTSTANVRNACHPFSTKDYFKNNYIVVHNGVIWNKSELRAIHEQRGIDYVSEQPDGRYNDSEALTYDIAMYLEGKVDKLTAEGTMAIIAIKRDKKGNPKCVYFGRNTGNPLIMKHTSTSFTLSSEGEGTLIDPNTMYCFNYKTQAVTRKACEFPSGTNTNYYGHYGSYDPSYDWIDDVSSKREILDHNNHLNRKDTAESTRNYFEGEEAIERNKAKAEKERLLFQSNHIRVDAIDIGEYELGVMRGRRQRLDDKFNLENITDDEMEEYYEYDDKIYYLTLAVNELSKEVSGNTQMGFLYSPDHGAYPLHRHTEEELVDPRTGRAYYPNAS